MPWEFRPTQSRLRVRVGEITETRFYARNFANHPVTGQAVPSVTPGWAAQSLHKIECFCFTQQRLDAGEEVQMPVQFYVGDDLPADVGTLSLSYTLYPVQPVRTTAETIERSDSKVVSARHEGYGGP
jgi:cytochrome c oxidase assembly protein subunit 11